MNATVGDFQDEILMAFGIDDCRSAVRVHSDSISLVSLTYIHGTRIMGNSVHGFPSVKNSRAKFSMLAPSGFIICGTRYGGKSSMYD